MKIKKIMVVSIILLAILTLGTVSAAEDISDNLAIEETLSQDLLEFGADDYSVCASDINETDLLKESDINQLNYNNDDILEDNNKVNEILTSNSKSFTDLNTTINGNDDSEINLNNDFIFNPENDSSFKTGIIINRDLTINGNGFTIDANHSASIFTIKSTSLFGNLNVTLKNIKFINANSTGLYGGAVDGISTIINCTFIGNSIYKMGTNQYAYGGAVFAGRIFNSTFINNYAQGPGGAIYASSASNCTFINNTADATGGAMNSGDAYNCIFVNNTSKLSGGAMSSGTAINCTFNNNTAGNYGYGGATLGVSVFNCNFTNNYAYCGGAVNGGIVRNSNFTNNKANLYGGAIYESQVGDSIFECNSAEYGGAIGETKATNCTFNYNNATYGGATYSSNISNDSRFYMNSADVENDNYKSTSFENGKTFADLNNLINNDGKSEINLNDNYIFNLVYDEEFTNGIVINRDLIINGNGFTINGNKEARLFNVFKNNVTFKNMIFTNGVTNNKPGGAINGTCTVINCTLYDNGFNTLFEGNAINSTFYGDRAIYNGSALNCTFLNESNDYYRAIIYSSAVNCIFKNNKGGVSYGSAVNCTFINCSSNYGGAMYECSAINCTIIGCSAGLYGGAMYDSSAINCTFINNTAQYGGAIASFSEYYVTNCTFINNTATEYGGATYGVNIIKCYFKNNHADEYGGAVCKSVVINSTFENNSALYGGAVYNAKVTDNSKFSNNVADYGNDTYDVKFLSSDSGKRFTDLNATINSNNESDIYLEDNYTFNILMDSELKDGIKILRPLTIHGNGFTLDGSYLSRIFDVSSSDVIFKDMIFINGQSTATGGAIHGKSTAINCTFKNNDGRSGGAASLVDAINCTFINNSADIHAGALYSGSAENCLFINNTAKAWGGAISAVSAINCTFLNNSASMGGAINNGYAINCTFKDNIGEFGGAMYKGTAINCMFKDNSAIKESGDGGAICYGDAMDCTFIGNSATRNGGAIIYGGSNNCTFINNTANNNGGAIYGGDYYTTTYGPTAYDSKFINNSAINGGALYEVNALNCSFTGNLATMNGGAVYNSSVFNSTFEYNKARNGGAISGIHVSNCIFNYNIATEYGGAVYNAKVSENSIFNNNVAETGNDIYNAIFFEVLNSKSFTELNNLINNNNDTEIYLDSNYAYKIGEDENYVSGIVINRKVTIYGNGFTLDGSNIARIFKVTNYFQAEFINITFINGHANSNSQSSSLTGGAVSGDATVINCTFISNYANDYGGAIYRSDAINCTFINNTAKYGGAAYYGDLIINCTFINNTANKQGSAVYGNYRFGNYTLVENCTIINNKNQNGIALLYVNKVNSTLINLDEEFIKEYILNVSDFYSTYGSGEKLILNLTYWDGEKIESTNIQIEVYDQYDKLILTDEFLSDESWVVSLDVGKYTAILKAMDYLETSSNITITINKASSDINISMGNLFYGDKIIVDVITNADGSVIVWVGNINKTIDVKANTPTPVDFGVLNPGIYEINGTFYGDNYIESNDIKTLEYKIKINETNMNTTIPKIKVNHDNNITVRLPNDANGTVTLTINGENYPVAILNGTANIPIPKLDNGNYNYNITYSGNNIYASFTKYGILVIDIKEDESAKNDAVLDVSVEDVKVGSDVVISIEINKNITGKVTVDGVEISIVDGKGTYTISGLVVGTYNCTVIFEGDGYFNASSKIVTFTVSKLSTPEIVIIPGEAVEGSDLIVDVSIIGATGNVLINGEIIDLNDYFASVTIKNLVAGNLTVTVVYNGDDKYMNSTASVNVVVQPKKDAELIADAENITVAEDAVISISFNKNITGNITVNGTDAVMGNGIAMLELGKLPAGTYTYIVKYEGDKYFNASNKTVTFTVFKLAAPEIIITPGEAVEGSNLDVNVEIAGATGSVVINGESIDLVDGKATTTIKDLVAGDLTVNVTYSGDDTYLNSSNIKTVKVETKKDSNLVASAEDVQVGSDVVIRIEINSNITGKVTVNGEEITITEGKGNYTISDLAIGNYNYTVNFEGDKYFNATSKTVEFNVVKKSLPENQDPFTNNDETTQTQSNNPVYSINLPEDATGNLTVTIGDKTYTKELVNGSATIEITDLPVGTYQATIEYSGDSNYAPIVKTVNATVKVDPKIVMKATTALYTAKYSVTVYGDDGKLAANTNVVFYINGKKITTGKTNAKGVATFTIPKTYVPAKKYTIKATALGKSASKKVTIKQILTLKKVTLKKSAKKLVLTATLKKVNGKYLTKKTITFKLNGKKYTAKTNSKGVAKYTVKSSALKKLKVGIKYIYSATYLKTTVKKTSAKVKK